jgi:tetratricopeptide (TPR) repeat protein
MCAHRPNNLILLAVVSVVAWLGRHPQGRGAPPGKKLTTVKPGSAGAAPGKPGSAQAAAKAQALILLTQANRKLRRGFYLEALELFKKAHKLYPSPKLHFNIAQTYMEVGRILKALAHYEQFVRKIKKQNVSKMLWNLAHARIFQLMGKIATVQLLTNVADAQVSADGRPVGKTPLSKPSSGWNWNGGTPPARSAGYGACSTWPAGPIWA